MRSRNLAATQARERDRPGDRGASFPYELVLENTIVGISYMQQRRFLWANARMAQIFGYEPGELDGQPVRMLYVTQEDYDKVGAMYSSVLRTDFYTHERAMACKNGDLIWCRISGRLIDPHDPGSPSVWVVQDISDRKRAVDQLRRANQRLEHTVERRTVNLRRTNEALRAEVERRRAAQEQSVESREKYRALFRNVPLGVIVANAEGEIVEVNSTLQSYVGASSRAVLEARLRDETRVVDANGRLRSLAALVREHAREGTSRKPARFELTWLAHNGRRREISVVAAPMSGHGLGVAYALSDITEQRRAREREQAQQAALAHAGRLSLIGQMTTALAHELGQPLNACQSYLGGLRHRLAQVHGGAPELGEALDKAISHLDQASDIIRNVRGFVARHSPQSEQVSLTELVQQTLALLEIQLRRAQVQVRLDAPPGRTTVRCNSVEIQQVLVNLVVNSIEAMDELPADERRIGIAIRKEGRSKLSVQIDDSGPGVPAELAERIFEPYLSTKPEGLGMGLMICRTIVESHGGSLMLVTHRPAPASLRFVLPIVRKARR